LASAIDIARGEYDEKEFYVLKQESNAWENDIWAWIDSQGEAKFKVPREECSADTDTVIGFEKPGNHEKLSNNTFEVRLRITTSKEIEWVKLYVNGSQRETFGSEKLVSTTITVDNNQAYELKGVVRTKDRSGKREHIRIGVMWTGIIPLP
jgi:hypothetical protein